MKIYFLFAILINPSCANISHQTKIDNELYLSKSLDENSIKSFLVSQEYPPTSLQLSRICQSKDLNFNLLINFFNGLSGIKDFNQRRLAIFNCACIIGAKYYSGIPENENLIVKSRSHEGIYILKPEYISVRYSHLKKLIEYARKSPEQKFFNVAINEHIISLEKMIDEYEDDVRSWPLQRQLKRLKSHRE